MNKTQYLENTLMALQTLRSHKLRSLLTTLGVIIGVGTVIVIASILTGMRSNIVALVEELGTENIYAFHLTTGPHFGPRDRREWVRKPLTVEDAEAIRTQSYAVRDVAYQGFGWRFNQNLRYQKDEYNRARVQGVSPNYGLVTNVALSEGRFISEIEDQRRLQVCVLGVNVVEALFPHHNQVAGREILIGERRFTVVGVLDKRKGAFLGENEEDNVVFIPYRTLRKISPRDDFLLLNIRAYPGQLLKAMDDAEAILRRQRGVRFDKANDFDLTTSDRIVKQFDDITKNIGLIAIAISAVGLLVGGIGVMNIMLVSVTERTREIGVRKAVGAKRQDIVYQFLFEAMTLTTSGGVIGIMLSVGVAYLVMWVFPSIPAAIPLWAVIAGISVSVGVGLTFGVWPAVKAARLDPIESLRYE
jgi:putative ABC transport system permease protein